MNKGAEFKMSNAQRQKGFTLLEVLFSLVIFAVGLLGYAVLQVANTKRSGDALNQVWTQYHARQLVDMMLANQNAMELGNFLTEGDAGGDGFMAWGADLSILSQSARGSGNINGLRCYASSGGANTNPFSNATDRNLEENRRSGGRACDFNQIAGDYVYRQFAYNIARDLPSAAFKIECDDVDGGDGDDIQCTSRGSRVTITVIWSYDPTRQDLGIDNRGCYASRAGDVLSNQNNFSLTGDECVQYSFFF